MGDLGDQLVMAKKEAAYAGQAYELITAQLEQAREECVSKEHLISGVQGQTEELLVTMSTLQDQLGQLQQVPDAVSDAVSHIVPHTVSLCLMLCCCVSCCVTVSLNVNLCHCASRCPCHCVCYYITY